MKNSYFLRINKDKYGQLFHAKWDKTTYYYFTSGSSRKVRDFDKKTLPRDPLDPFWLSNLPRYALEVSQP